MKFREGKAQQQSRNRGERDSRSGMKLKQVSSSVRASARRERIAEFGDVRRLRGCGLARFRIAGGFFACLARGHRLIMLLNPAFSSACRARLAAAISRYGPTCTWKK